VDDREWALFLTGMLVGALIMTIVALAAIHSNSSAEVSDRVSFEQVNNTYREIGVNTSSGDRLSCTISRLDEVQISDMSYIYGNGSCVSTIQVNGSELDVPTEKVDVLFRVNDSRFDLGFDLPESYVVCDIAEGDEQKAGPDKWIYVDAVCSYSSGSLYEKWNDSEFANFNVHERGEEVLKNESK
jgi:hypothetical protein